MRELGKLIYDGDSVYELDEDCLRKKEAQERAKEMEWQQNRRQPRDQRQSRQK